MNVLLVEDEELVRQFVEDVLNDAGMHVVSVSAPEKALALLDTDRPPRVLVTDVNLGSSIDGFQVAAAARRKWPHIGVVVISGVPSNASRMRAPDRFLHKPFGMQDLLRTVQAVAAGGCCCP